MCLVYVIEDYDDDDASDDQIQHYVSLPELMNIYNIAFELLCQNEICIYEVEIFV